MQTLKISENQVYKDQAINSLKHCQLVGWDTFFFFKIVSQNLNFTAEIYFESAACFKVIKGCKWLNPLFLNTL